jgi:hypothetical protein
LKPINRVEVKAATQNLDEPVEFGNGGKEMAEDVCVGDNIDVMFHSFQDESF